jgi:hypothetical protein
VATVLNSADTTQNCNTPNEKGTNKIIKTKAASVWSREKIYKATATNRWQQCYATCILPSGFGFRTTQR